MPGALIPRRALGVAAAALTPALLVASLACGLRGDGHTRLAGLVVAGLALSVAALNAYLSLLRYPFHAWRNGSREGYRHVSGVPLLGTLLAAVTALVSFGSVLPAALGLVAVITDPGGVLWLVIATWRDASFWRGR